jgi:hypothetical protein
LVQILLRIDPGLAKPETDRFYAVVSGSVVANDRCPISGERIAPGTWQVAYAGNGLNLSPAAAETLVPSLANALHGP